MDDPFLMRSSSCYQQSNECNHGGEKRVLRRWPSECASTLNVGHVIIAFAVSM